MFGIGGSELLVIALVAILVFGPGRIPEVMRSISSAYRELTRLRRRVDDTVAELRQEIDLKSGVYDDLSQSLRPPSGARVSAKPGQEHSMTAGATPAADTSDPDDYLARPPAEQPARATGSAADAGRAAGGDDYLAGGGADD